MKILLVAATRLEIKPFIAYLSKNFVSFPNDVYRNEDKEVKILVTGIGLTFTAYELGRYLALEKVDLAINAGIAGAIDPKLKIGQVVLMQSEEFGDLGAEDRDGGLVTPFAMELMEKDVPPFSDGQLLSSIAVEGLDLSGLIHVSGLSVNKVHGAAGSIARMRQNSHAQVETMEGAAFFYSCLRSGVPFAALRSISNYVEPRNRESWDIPLAIKNLNETLIKLITA